MDEYDKAFQLICSSGQLYIAKWILEIKPTIDIFWDVCIRGYYHIAKWLLKIKPTIKLSIENTRHIQFYDIQFYDYDAVNYNNKLDIRYWLQALVSTKLHDYPFFLSRNIKKYQFVCF